MDLTNILQDVVTLFAIVNPISGVPFFLDITKRKSAKERNKIAYDTAFIGAVILVVFSFAGQKLLDAVFHISLNDVKIAGGILLLVIAITNIMQNTRNEMHGVPSKELSAVPLAFPLLVGPGSLVTSVLIFQKQGFLVSMGIIIVVGLCLWLTLRFAAPIFKLLGDVGSKIFSKIMFVILAAIAVKFIMTGITSYLNK